MYLQKHLKSQFSASIRERGAFIFGTGCVAEISGNQWNVEASVRGSRVYHVELERMDDLVHAICECPYFDSEGLCKHIWAAILAADQKNYLLGQIGSRPPRAILPGWDDDAIEDFLDDDDEEDFPDFIDVPAHRRAAPAIVKQPRQPVWRDILAQIPSQTRAADNGQAWRDGNEIYYVIDTSQTLYGSGLYLEIAWREFRKNGTLGKLKSSRISRAYLAQIPDERDRDILLMLGGIPDPYAYNGNSFPSVYRLGNSLARVLVPKLCATGRCRLRAQQQEPFENQTALAWDDGPAWQFRLGFQRERDRWLVRGFLERGQEKLDLAQAALLLDDGLVFIGGRAAHLEHGGNFSWITLLRRTPHIEVPFKHGYDFVAEMLNRPGMPPVDWPEELRFEQVKAAPQPCAKLEKPKYTWGNKQDSLLASLSFDYGGKMISTERPSLGLYDARERRFWQRDAAAEQAACARLEGLGARKIEAYTGHGSAPRWEFASKKLPKLIRELVQDGWRIESEGKLFRNAGGLRAELTSGIDWFELHGAVDFGSEEVKLPELLRALERGETLVTLHDGSYGVIPAELQEKYGFLMRLGRKHDDHVRFSRAQAGLLDVLLAGRAEVRVDEVFSRVREELRSFDGIAPADQPSEFVGQLRDYQLDGLAWIHFLRRFGFGGCLADDMGVGKTPQVLALLETRRAQEPKVGPSLVVVPRSLVYNWQREAERFTPRLRVLDHTGLQRAKNLEKFHDYDLILTTYGTLRRDVATFQSMRFDYVILDEAQAIKNASTESAKAARLLQANHRLALSGTPVENHLGELWSLFEFLNPGMLGAASVFQSSAGALRNPDQEKRELLARAVRPFILRRTKGQVARELPPKTEQTLYCELDATQRRLYNELRDHYRAALIERIEREGMARAQIQILEALLRLRQAACHPGLIDSARVAEPSAKLEALLPQLSEVMAEGHKALVFSQFTSFLAILRRQLDAEKIEYEYLDGKTRNREECVTRFQTDSNCKLFLVSLKAGGLGLNLCAAEYVFLLDPWWNPAVEAQAIDRAHRIGQNNPVFAYRLIAKETVEEKVIELQNTKRDLADAIIRADSRLVGNLKREDLELLLS